MVARPTGSPGPAQALHVAEVWDGTRAPVGAGIVRDKTALLSLSYQHFMNGVGFSSGLTCSQGEQFWDETVGWITSGILLCCFPAAPAEPGVVHMGMCV